MNIKKCKVVINKQGELIEADFYGIFQRAWTHAESALIGGRSAGQVAYPVAVVDWGEGLMEVNMENVKEIKEELNGY